MKTILQPAAAGSKYKFYFSISSELQTRLTKVKAEAAAQKLSFDVDNLLCKTLRNALGAAEKELSIATGQSAVKTATSVDFAVSSPEAEVRNDY